MRAALAWALLLGPVGAKFAYEGFRQHPSLNIAGDAAVAVDELWLTPSAPESAGAVYFSRAQDISIGFVTEFEFDLSVFEGERGEGFAFTAQQDDPFQLGAPGPSIGYGGITSGFAIEFDTHKDEDMGDPDAGHVSIHLSGDGSPLSAEEGDGGRVRRVPRLSTQPRRGAVEYSPPNMNVYCFHPAKSLRQQEPVLTVDVGLLTGDHWVGFTASTNALEGGSRHVIRSWSFERFGVHRCEHDFLPPDCTVDATNVSSQCAPLETCRACTAAPTTCAWCPATSTCVPATLLNVRACSRALSLDPLECRVGLPTSWVWAPVLALAVVAGFAVALKAMLPDTPAAETAVRFVAAATGGALFGMAVSVFVSLGLAEMTQSRGVSATFAVVFLAGAAIVVSQAVSKPAESPFLAEAEQHSVPAHRSGAWLSPADPRSERGPSPPESAASEHVGGEEEEEEALLSAATDEGAKVEARGSGRVAAPRSHTCLLLSFSALLLLAAGISTFLDRLWMRLLPIPARVTLFAVLGTSLHFLVLYIVQDLTHRLRSACTAACAGVWEFRPAAAAAESRGRRRIFVTELTASYEHVRVLCVTSVCSGLFFGLVFGLMDITSDDSLILSNVALQRELIYAYPVGAILGAASSLANAVIAESHAAGYTVAESVQRRWGSVVQP